MDPKKNTVIPSKSESWRMFDEISPKYDFLNSILSFGLHAGWREQLADYLPDKKDLKVLDLATGTADVLLSLFKKDFNMQSGCGIDLSDKMMDIGRNKIARQGLEGHITLHHGDANQIPFNENTFDAVTIAFGLRNMEDPERVLSEIYRVLNSGGRSLILEFSIPKNILMRYGCLLYLRYGVPLIGALLTGHYQAYRYLDETIEAFPSGEHLCAFMFDAGFKNVTSHPLLFGVATIYHGDKI